MTEKQRINKMGINAITSPFRWIIIIGISFFIASGRIDILRAWLYIGIYILGSLISVILVVKKVPDLVNERGKIKKGSKKWDIFIIIIYFLFAIVITPAVAGIDTRFEIFIIPFIFFYFGVGLYLISLVFSIWPMLYNPFFEGTVRIQEDRNQTVVENGPYRIVRHPGYLGMLIGSLPIPFAFGSVLSLIPMFIMAVLVFIRTYFEDKTLQNELAGYNEYCKKVKYRLIPFIW